MAEPDYPDVPIAPGVPPLLRPPNAAAAVTAPVMLADAVPFLIGETTWGIFRDGAQVITAETVLAVEYKKNSSIADYPVERGSFESYNKVEIPFDARVRFASGGTNAQRTALLNSIAAIADDLNLYDVVTPEAVYQNVNIAHYDYRRTSTAGLGLLSVDVWCLQVRIAPGPGGDVAKSPSAAPQFNGGAVQTTPPTAAQSAGLENMPENI